MSITKAMASRRRVQRQRTGIAMPFVVAFGLGVASVPMQTAEAQMAVAPAGNSLPPNAIPLSVPGAYAFPAPPANFNPATASPEQLQAYGLPPRPNQQANPKGYASWLNAVSIPNRITPVLKQTDIYSRPMQEAPAGRVPESQPKAHAAGSPSQEPDEP
jgi:hypothetical protein